jgi:hypothetical protein
LIVEEGDDMSEAGKLNCRKDVIQQGRDDKYFMVYGKKEAFAKDTIGNDNDLPFEAPGLEKSRTN